ncbi:MAG: hypothetical protein HOP19_13065, partial [Acidobacteria bacterium]|nr:hypothetical protein [Acidobacteriota bacterium]
MKHLFAIRILLFVTLALSAGANLFGQTGSQSAQPIINARVAPLLQ